MRLVQNIRLSHICPIDLDAMKYTVESHSINNRQHREAQMDLELCHRMLEMAYKLQIEIFSEWTRPTSFEEFDEEGSEEM